MTASVTPAASPSSDGDSLEGCLAARRDPARFPVVTSVIVTDDGGVPALGAAAGAETRDRVVKGRKEGRFRPRWPRLSTVVEGSRSSSDEPTVHAPRAPLGHLSRLGFALRSAPDVDAIARCIIDDLGQLPGVARVGLALTEGGGRRLRFIASERMSAEELDWCHIDAYDDVPLTAVVRDAEPVLGDLDHLETKFPDLVSHKRGEGVVAMAAWPLPGTGSPIGGIALFYDAVQAFPEPHLRLLEAAARRVAEAVRRVRVTTGRDHGDARPDDPAVVGEGRRARVLLESDPRAPGTARRFLREHLAAWEVDDDALETAQLCLSELVTNVVMHAQTSSQLTVHLEGDVLTVVVRDLGGAVGDPRPSPPPGEGEDPLRVHGRGLMLVDALADRWGTEVDATGTSAWFTLELGAGHRSSAETG